MAVNVLGNAWIKIQPQFDGFNGLGVRLRREIEPVGDAARRAGGDLRDAAGDADDLGDRLGDAGEAARRAAGGADDLRDSLDRAGGAAGDAADEASRGWRRALGTIGSGIKATFLGAGVAAVGGFGLGVTQAISAEGDRNRLQAMLGVDDAEAARLGGVAGRLYANAYGESLGAVNEAIASVIHNVEGMSTASDAALESFTGRAISLADILQRDVADVSRAVGVILANELAPNAEAALDVIARGTQIGGDRAGDLLDTFTEYGPLFAELGIGADTATGLLVQGLKAGARDTDFVADAIKELLILVQELPKGTAEAFGDLGLDAEDMQRRIAGGGAEAAAAFQELLRAVSAVKDPVDQNRIAVGLFGTKAEDLQQTLFSLDPSTAVAALGEVGGAAQRLDTDLNKGAGVALETLKRQLTTGLTELGGVVLPPLATLATTVSGAVGPVFRAGGLGVKAFFAAFREGDVTSGGFVGLMEKAGNAARGFVDDIQPGIDAITDFATNSAWPAIQNVGGIFQRLWAADIQPVASVVAGVLVVAFNALGAVLSGVVGPALSGITGFIRDNQTLITALAIAIGTGVVALYAYRGAVVAVQTAKWMWMTRTLLMQAAIRGMQGVMIAARGAVMALNTAFLANPIGFVIALVAGLALGIVYLYKRSETARNIINAVFRAIWTAIKFVWDLIKTNWPLLLTILTGPIGIAVRLIVKHWDSIRNGAAFVFNWVKSNWPLLLAIITGPIGIAVRLIVKHWDTIWAAGVAVYNWIVGLPGKIAGILLGIASIISKPFVDGWNIVSGWITTAVGWWTALPGRIASALVSIGGKVSQPFIDGWNTVSGWVTTAVGWFTGIPGKVADALSGVASTVAAPFREGFNLIARGWNATVGKLSFTVPSWVPLGLGGKGFSMPKIPLLAKGGIFTSPGMAIVGDAGPELLFGTRGAGVAPLPPDLDLGGRILPFRPRGGPTVTLTVNVDARGATDPAAVEAAVRRGADRAVTEMATTLTRLIRAGEGAA